MTTSELVVIVGVAIIAALLKSVTGLGYPLLLVPALALFLDIADAIVIVAPSNLALNAQIAWVNRTSASDARTLRPFIGAGIIGSVIGTLLLPVLPDRGLRVALVLIIVAFLADRSRQSRVTHTRDPFKTDRLATVTGFFAGVFQGATGVAGPVVSAWFLSRQIVMNAFVLAVTATFALMGAAQIVVLVFQPEFADDLFLGLVLVPFALLMVPLGGFIRARMDTSRFEQLIIAVLIAAAISLAVRLV